VRVRVCNWWRKLKNARQLRDNGAGKMFFSFFFNVSFRKDCRRHGFFMHCVCLLPTCTCGLLETSILALVFPNPAIQIFGNMFSSGEHYGHDLVQSLKVGLSLLFVTMRLFVGIIFNFQRKSGVIGTVPEEDYIKRRNTGHFQVIHYARKTANLKFEKHPLLVSKE